MIHKKKCTKIWYTFFFDYSVLNVPLTAITNVPLPKINFWLKTEFLFSNSNRKKHFFQSKIWICWEIWLSLRHIICEIFFSGKSPCEGRLAFFDHSQLHRSLREDTDLHVENVFGFGFRHAAIVSGRKAPTPSWVAKKPFFKKIRLVQTDQPDFFIPHPKQSANGR